MSALLKYIKGAIFLALALAISFYVGIVGLEYVGLVSLDDVAPVPAKPGAAVAPVPTKPGAAVAPVPTKPGAAVAPVPAKPGAAVAPVDPARAALVDEELDYRVAQRLGSLEGWRAFLAAHGSGVYTQSARAEVESLLLAEKAPAPTAAKISNGASPDARAASEAVGPAPPSPGTEVAALTPDEVCKRDEDRLARLRGSPSSDEGARFANELGCEKLRPQLLGLMERLGYLVPAPAAAEVSNGASPDAKAASEAARRAPPLAGTEIAALTPDEICKRDGDRLARLRGSPSGEEAQSFARELNCEKLRPQLIRLMESLGFAPSGADPDACRRETAELNRIRATPDLSDAKRFASTVTCNALKPQAARLLESLTE